MTQEDVFKSIKENVSDSGDMSGHMFMAILLGAAAILMLVTLINLRSKRSATPKALNHSGKLLKEISKKINLKPAELKQLKLLAEGERAGDTPVENPLVFILCPSAMVGAMRGGRAKVDRRIMAGLAKKMGLVSAKAK